MQHDVDVVVRLRHGRLTAKLAAEAADEIETMRDVANVAMADRNRAVKEIEALAKALRDCAAGLAASLDEQYAAKDRTYESVRRRYDERMGPVVEAQRLLGGSDERQDADRSEDRRGRN